MFGPQKGVARERLSKLDRHMKHYAQVIQEESARRRNGFCGTGPGWQPSVRFGSETIAEGAFTR
jgi:hypothetical protein